MEPPAESVPVMSAGPPTTKLAVASILETEMVPPDKRLLTVKFEVSTLDVLRVCEKRIDALKVPEISTLSLEVILAAIRGPETVRFEVSTLDALRVPPMKASLVTVLRLVIVKLEVSMLDVLRVCEKRIDALKVPEISTLSLEVILAAIRGPETVRFEVSTLDALRVPVIFAGPSTTKLAVASTLDTEMVPPERRLLTVRFEEAIFEAVRVLSAPLMVTLSEEVMPAAERVPVDVRLRPWTVPVTTTEVPSITPREALAPWTSPVTVKDGPVREPPALRVPVIFAGPPTTKLAVASMLETEMVPPDRRLLTVKLDVATLVDEIVPLETIFPWTSKRSCGVSVPRPTNPSLSVNSPPEIKKALALSSKKFTMGCAPVCFAMRAGPVPLLVILI
jgi:hypothetical protein